MGRPGVHQVLAGSGEQRKMEETSCEVICGSPTTPTVKGCVKVKVEGEETQSEICWRAFVKFHRSICLEFAACQFAESAHSL